MFAVSIQKLSDKGKLIIATMDYGTTHLWFLLLDKVGLQGAARLYYLEFLALKLVYL